MTESSSQITECGRRSGLFHLLALAVVLTGASCDDARSQPGARTPAGRDATAGRLSFENLTVPRAEVHAGGPPKDGIPAITDPNIVAPDKAEFLTPQSRVIATTIGTTSRAWPIAVLNYHEIINDTLGGVPIAVTYCPLCDSAAIFDRRAKGGTREFGVSGLLYNSNVLMYERVDGEQSLFSQLQGRGISGPLANQPLKTLPVELTTWQDWRDRYPNTTVASLQTGHRRDYTRNPYGDYFRTSSLMFPVKEHSDRLTPKQKVLGLWSGDSFLAVPLSMAQTRSGEFDVTVGDNVVRLAAIPSADSLRVVTADDGIQWMYSLWFAWYAFHPETQVLSE
ncbi:DUF3179 domain-containing protein [bacterium]|nr:DUF3179 domain-containing protein [bacterium]